jgi:hypothetical protein
VTWETIPTGDNDPGIWIDGIMWDELEAWNDGWIAVDPADNVWAEAA